MECGIRYWILENPQYNMIKKHAFKFGSLLFISTLIFSLTAHAQEEPVRAAGRAYHVVIVWLKESGNEAARRQYIETSKRLAKLPGVLSYHIGTVLPSKGEVVDSSFDIAVVSAFENQQALSNYVQRPEHKEIIEEGLRPLVNKCIVYDFVE